MIARQKIILLKIVYFLKIRFLVCVFWLVKLTVLQLTLRYNTPRSPPTLLNYNSVIYILLFIQIVYFLYLF